MHRAFLVLWIDTTLLPPAIVDAGIYSEETPSSPNLLRFRPQAILGVVSPNSFENARNHIMALVKGHSYQWLHGMKTLVSQFNERSLKGTTLAGQTR